MATTQKMPYDDFGKNYYKKDDIKALDAKFIAQQIAFSPLTFQAVRALKDFGLMQAVEDAGEGGITTQELAKKTGVSLYGVCVLCEMALGLKVFLYAKDSTQDDTINDTKYVLGKTGWMLLEDTLTCVNFNFVNDVCYKGAFDLMQSIKEGRPCGLKQIEQGGERHNTVYEALSTLPKQIQKSWLEFDHFYSSIAFSACLPIVFENNPRHILDIGGNTAKWAISCCQYSPKVKVTILDLPGQIDMAKENVKKAGLKDRVGFCTQNILDQNAPFVFDAIDAATTNTNAATNANDSINTVDSVDNLNTVDSVDAVWMSQFLDCFSLEQVTAIFKKIAKCCPKNCNVYVLEPLWDKQRFRASSFSLLATSLYFTCIANGNSKMYRLQDLLDAAKKAGFMIQKAHHNIGSNAYSLLLFKKIKE